MTLVQSAPPPVAEHQDRRPAEPTEPAPPEDIYTPIEAAIDRDAERTVCARHSPEPERKPIVSVNGEDVELNDSSRAA